jgi:S-DNA-T family DNA segregation ATPase FtsK/SpoIIIE
MKSLSRAFTPTRNRRLNELIGFLLLVSALLLFLALVSYSPLDRSFNTAAPRSEQARNWVGVVGAYGSDLLLQLQGISSFLLPLFLLLLGMRWLRSREVACWAAKTIGCIALLVFLPALLALLPWHWRWMGALPVEGLLGRIFGDVLVHYLNLPGAYLVTMSALAVALYLSTTFSFGQVQLWFETRCSFVFAAWQRVQDWREARKRARLQKELQKKRASRPTVAVASSRAVLAAEAVAASEEGASPEPLFTEAILAAPPVERRKTGIERAHEEDELEELHATPEVSQRADNELKTRTTMPKVAGSYKLPSSALLHRPDEHQAVDEDELKSLAGVLVSKCSEFDVHGAVTQINPGPVVTTFEFKPEAGIKYSRITGLCDDLCLALRAESILIERMAGKSTVGIQVPNRERETIWLREVVESQEFLGSRSRLMLALGKDINGRITVADLASMPHLLIAGSTGAGKSVAINAMIMSLLYKSTPDQVRLILVDPKRLELGVYEGVPHLYTPIITEPKLAANALRNAVREMERRLKLLAQKGVRNIDQYNRLFDESTPSLFESGEEEEGPIPYIVIVIDELADLMLLDGSNVEESITRLAQMARAVGIHLILATQRPSVDVITGLIKANFPARISFRVATKVDSRTILDANGAEALLGRGDMLYLPSGSARVQRVHAPFVTEKEIAAVVEFWKAQGLAQYQAAFLEVPKDEKRAEGSGGEGGEDEHDDLYQDAVRLVLEFGKASTSLLQRRLRIGYGRAAHLIDLMEKDGVVGAADGPRPREVLKRPDWLAEVEQSLS